MAESKSDIPLAEMDIESNPLLSNNNEEPNVDATSSTNDEVPTTFVDTTTTAACKVKSTTDILACSENSDSQGLFRIEILHNSLLR